MKKYILIIGLAVACLIYSCGKTDTASNPTKPPVTTPPGDETKAKITVTGFEPATAEVGTELTITGTNFGTLISDVKISFGGAGGISPKSVTDTKIVVIVPANAKTGNISVTVKNNAAVISNSSFAFIPAYVVKTIGISRVRLGLDDNNKFTLAELYGGGNTIIVRPGTENKMEFQSGNFNVLPDVFFPDVTFETDGKDIDNGNPPVDTSGVIYPVFKIKGFDKKKTGFSQLNLVIQKFVWMMNPGNVGYRPNLVYLYIHKMAGTKNADYGLSFLKGVLNGPVNVTRLEIAKPKSENPYVSRDQIITFGQLGYGVSIGAPYRVDFTSLEYRLFFSNGNQGIGGPLKFEWVNANSAKITQYDPYVFEAKFDNIKKGGFDQAVEARDSIDKVFLRVTGFNRDDFGYNQLRLFLADDSFSDGSLQIIFNAKQTTVPSLNFFKQVFMAPGLNLYVASPNWPHY